MLFDYNINSRLLSIDDEIKMKWHQLQNSKIYGDKLQPQNLSRTLLKATIDGDFNLENAVIIELNIINNTYRYI